MSSRENGFARTNLRWWRAAFWESTCSPHPVTIPTTTPGWSRAITSATSHPDIPGIELCQRLRDDPELPPSTPIVMTTAGPASRTQRLDAYRAGVWEFLSQPVDAEALLLKLDAFVRAKREIDRSRE